MPTFSIQLIRNHIRRVHASASAPTRMKQKTNWAIDIQKSCRARTDTIGTQDCAQWKEQATKVCPRNPLAADCSAHKAAHRLRATAPPLPRKNWMQSNSIIICHLRLENYCRYCGACTHSTERIVYTRAFTRSTCHAGRARWTHVDIHWLNLLTRKNASA